MIMFSFYPINADSLVEIAERSVWYGEPFIESRLLLSFCLTVLSTQQET